MWGFITGVLLIAVGLLGAADLIIAKRPDAKEALIDKLSPYQGWLGTGSAFWGVWTVINFIWHLGDIGAAPIFWLTYLAAGVLAVGLGLVLGVSVLKTLTTNRDALDKLDDLIERLSPYRGSGGVGAIGLGLWMVVATILWG